MTKWAVRLAAGWAAAYAFLALGWAVTGHGFPFGPHDPGRDGSPLRDLDPAVGAPLFAAVLAGTAVVLLIMSGRDLPPGPVRTALLTWVALVAAVLLLVVSDVRMLTIAGYLPILIIGFPFGWPPVDYSDVFTWALANQAIAVTGGLLLARAALTWSRRTAGACVTCGRTSTVAGWTTRASAARWGRVVSYVAAAIPAVYASVRLAWAAGLPVGISQDFLDELHRTGLVWAGAGLGAFALVGSVLTMGLTQRWGERFAGRRVPIGLATVPATLVAVFITSASVAFLATGGLTMLFAGEADAATLPMYLWPVWGVTLAAAALAYHLRRRPACPKCGRGDAAPGVVPALAADAY